MITGGLIAIGILALIAAIFLLRGKEKTSQANQQAVPKRAADKQTVAPAKPSASANTKSSFPAPQVPFPVSAVSKQAVAPAEPSISAESFFVPQEPFPTSTADKQTVALAEPSVSTETRAPSPVSTADKRTAAFAWPSESTETLTEISFPVQSAPAAQTPVQELQLRQTPAQKVEQDQPQAPVALNGQLTAKPDQGLSEMQTQSSIPSGGAPSSPSIDQQMAELIADTWALQQQAAELGRRLNYLSSCIQYSSASEPHDPHADGNG